MISIICIRANESLGFKLGNEYRCRHIKCFPKDRWRVVLTNGTGIHLDYEAYILHFKEVGN